jgi:hypothetical protein
MPSHFGASQRGEPGIYNYRYEFRCTRAIIRFVRSIGATSRMQSELIGRHPGAPMVVRHLDVCGAQKRERIIDCIGEARHATDIGALANALGADRVMR